MTEQAISNAELTKRLRAWAKKRDMGYADLAYATGYSYDYAFQILYGDAEATLNTLILLGLHFGKDVAAELLQAIPEQEPMSQNQE